ncbi:MAG: MFS transporter [Bacteroidales bacterium]|nr:MFS transporter [Bacteroidales bacterium]
MLLGNVNPQERKTFILHLIYALIEAILTGAFVLNEFIFIKSLNGSNYQLSMLFQFSMLVLLVSVFANEIIAAIRNKKKALRFIAVVTRLPLLLMFLFPGNPELISANPVYHYIFLGIFFMYFSASPIVFPTINLFLKNNYTHQNFGRLYSFVTTLSKVIVLVVTFLFGILLDYDNFAFRYVYPILAVLGIISVFIFSTIDFGHIEVKEKLLLSAVFKKSITTMKQTLIFNKPFRDFQISFMFYGFAFMSTITVITIFYQEVLDLNYTSVAFYKNAYNVLAILMLPFFGRIISRIDPRYFSVISFASLMFYIICIMLTQYLPTYTLFLDVKIYGMLMAAIFFHAFFAATMSLLWSIGSAYFCEKEEAGVYQSVHLSLTGFRAVFVPILGIYLYEKFGFTITFIFAAISLATAIVILIYSKNKKNQNLFFSP